MTIRPEIITLNERDTTNGENVEVNLWAIRRVEDSHDAGIAVFIKGMGDKADRSLEFTLKASEVASLLQRAVQMLQDENPVVRIPFDKDEV